MPLASGLMRRSFCPRLARGYADLWSALGISHELTISLGVNPRSFSPEEELKPILRNLVRACSRKMRSLPKRQALSLCYADPRALMVAGFYEPTKRSGELFPHWHGGVALQPGEEPLLREILWERIGEDAQNPLALIEPCRTTRPLIKVRNAMPTFHLAPITTMERWIRYANKKTSIDEIVHWTTADLLPA